MEEVIAIVLSYIVLHNMMVGHWMQQNEVKAMSFHNPNNTATFHGKK